MHSRDSTMVLIEGVNGKKKTESAWHGRSGGDVKTEVSSPTRISGATGQILASSWPLSLVS